MSVRPHDHQRRLPRPLRVLLLVAMVWTLAGLNLFHTHASAVAHAATLSASATCEQANAAGPTEAPCAVCEWKASHPSTPVSAGASPLLLAVTADRGVALPRAPPVARSGLVRNRAPPILA